MPPVKIHSCLIQGLEGKLVEVEADIQRGMSAFTIVGLGDQSVQESKERIRSAIRSTSAEYPVQKKIINLAPASLKKQGPIFDLPIAISLLLASGQIAGAASHPHTAVTNKSATPGEPLSTDDMLFIGELALNGELRPVPNVFSIALFARDNGFKKLIVPADNFDEASLLEDLQIIAPRHLQELLDHLQNGDEIPSPQPIAKRQKPSDKTILANPTSTSPIGTSSPSPLKILSRLPSANTTGHPSDSNFTAPTPPPTSIYQTIQGQTEAKRALLLAAAGGHHLLLHGSPGIGKTMLARAIPELLPPLSDEEFFETLRIYSAAKLPTETLFRRERPFRQAHQTSSLISLTGGGNPITPGEISLSHHGVLFLDEFPEFPRSVIEALRQPLEDRRIYLARQGTQVNFPAKFTLVAAMNPCPCGFNGDRQRECTCTAYQIHQYRQKLSGPILDRIDLTVALHRPEFKVRPSAQPPAANTPSSSNTISSSETPGPIVATAEDLAKLRLQVQIARERQKHRFKNTVFHHNADLGSGDLKRYLRLDYKAEEYLDILAERTTLSARGYTQLLRTALTIADLKNTDIISNLELAEAFQFKNTILF